MKLDITELRKARRPLWMTELDVESYADFIGGGGDIYADRLPVDWARLTGEELLEEDKISENVGELLEDARVYEDYVS